ncbi:MAG TPA: ABC transporter permease [Vicinamibacterales bacterium]|jgi:predicted permease|nr:ABC transporter permease [Vicinamibacterales bacterium]
MTPHRPPRLAEWLLARFVWADERATVLGDLDEQFGEQVASIGAARASLWYWREALRLIWGFWWWALRLGCRRAATMATDDVRYAMRRLRKQPVASLVSVATLACAIGAAAATWTLVSAVLLHPLKLDRADRIVDIAYRAQDAQGTVRTDDGYNYPEYVALRDAAPMHVAAWGAIGSSTPLTISTGDDERRIRVIYASHDLFDVLGVRMSLGRFFGERDDRRGAPLVAVLSDRLWRGQFASDANVVGRVIHMRDRAVTIVGVAPRAFRGLEVGRTPDLILPLHAIDQVETYPNLFGARPVLWWITPVARLPDGMTTAQMEERLNGLQLDPDNKKTFVLNGVETAALNPTSRVTVTQFSRLLGATVAMLLAIGSVTVGMLLVLRTDARRGELAMCLALGASRARVAAGIAIEGLLLAVAGAALSLPVSQMLFAGLGTFQLPGGIGVNQLDLTIDGRVLAGVAVAGIASVLLMALVSSAFGLRRDPGDALRSHAGATSRMTRRGSRAALVTAQVAVTLVLVTGAGLFARSVVRALSLNPGIDTSRLFRVDLPLPGYGYDAAREWAFVDVLRERLAHQPAIASVGVSESWEAYKRIQVDGTTIELPSFASPAWIDSQYFSTIGLPISMGRAFTTSDRIGAPPVAVVTASLAKIIDGDGHPIGHRIGHDSTSAEVVGVVPDLVFSPAGTKPLGWYMPLAQAPPLPTYPGAPGPKLFVRATHDAADARALLTAAVRDIDPQIRLKSMSTIDEWILDDMAPQRFGATVMGALGAIALLLSVFGTYVLVESMATLRRREMGIRAALGAPDGHLKMLLFSETFRLVGAGLLLGFGLSWLGAGTIRAFLFQVEPFDPLVTLSVAALIVVLAVLVTLRPALAAARVDLAQVLHDE